MKLASEVEHLYSGMGWDGRNDQSVRRALSRQTVEFKETEKGSCWLGQPVLNGTRMTRIERRIAEIQCPAEGTPEAS